MEFKLNKIDTDIRAKMEEEIRADKVTKNNNISIKKELLKEKNQKVYIKKKLKGKQKFFQVECIKYANKELEIEGEKLQIIDVESEKGQRIDAKK